MTDCLIVGFNDTNFEEYEKMVRSMGVNTGAYQDLNLSFIQHQDSLYRGLDLLTHLHYEGKAAPARPFNNVDFLWPVITYLSSFLHHRGLSTDYVNLFHFEKDKLRQKLLRDDILTVAITTTLYTAPHPILEIVSFIRQYNKSVKIVIGGPYIGGQSKTVDAEALIEQFIYLGGDVYVMGSEGELALSHVVTALKEGRSLDGISNIAYRDGENFILAKTESEYNSLEENMVIYNLFSPDEVGQFVTLRTAKSCPFACSFCGFPERAGAYKYLGVEHVERELNAIADLGSVTTLTFIDDTFNVPKQRFKDLLRMMIRNKYGFKWNSFYRSDHGDEETIELMAQSGCEGVILGIESGSDKILELMNKSSRRKHYLKAIPLLESHGIASYASVIVGFPGETLQTLEETVSLIEEAKPSYYRAQLWYCDPITPIYREKEKHGIKGEGFNWRHNTMDVETACDLINRVFLKVENSIWLLQNGFELWSDFYLQRHGMTRPQIKQYLRSFDAAIKEKLLYPNKKEPSHGIMQALRDTARFDERREPDMRPIEKLSGRHYVEAENFWLGEFAHIAPASNIALLSEENGQAHQPWNTVPIEIEQEVLDKAAASCGADLKDVLLAAYSVLLSRLNGVQDTTVLTSLKSDDEQQINLPLRLYPSWSKSFAEFAHQAEETATQAARHQTYAFDIVTNPLRMKYLGGACPVLDTGYFFSAVPDASGGSRFEDAFKYQPEVIRDLKLVLQATTTAGAGVQIEMSSRLHPETTERIASYIKPILAEVALNASAPLGEVGLQRTVNDPVFEADALNPEVFNFQF